MRPRSGFTLIEIMLVVIIIGILTAMIIPNIAGRSDQARKTAARSDIQSNLATALDLYHMDNGQYPATEQGLNALIVLPAQPPVPNQWNGPYLKKKTLPKDPWGRDYVYVSPGVHNVDTYDLSSLGPKGIAGSDNITNWDSQ